MITMAYSWDTYDLPPELPAVVINDPAMPLISVVTPSYNQGAYIRETIESVLSQDYPNIEYWVIDGGSTDETLAILREYEADPRFHWLSEPDRGQAEAVNKGWRRCRGALLGWLNSDDTYLPGALRTVSGYFAEHPQDDLVFGDALRVDHDGAPLDTIYGRPIDLAAMLDQNYVAQPAVFQRRRLVEHMGPLHIELRFALDFDYYARAALKHRFAYIAQTLATYRMHPVSKTVAGGSAFMGEFALVTERLLCRPGLPPELLHRRRAILSDAYLRVTLLALRERQFAVARHHLLRALCLHPLRPRILGVAVLALDTLLNTSVYSMALDWGRRARRQLAHAASYQIVAPMRREDT
jgi:glycosyltransferase involved in cell wall biosynthesis